VASPTLFSRFVIKILGKGIKGVIGFKKGGGSQIQSFLFPKDQYNLAQAKAWIKEHKYHVSETEAYDVSVIHLDNECYLTEIEETLIADYQEVLTDNELIVLATKKENKDEYAWLTE
jgi:hypothetical protein